MSDGVDAGFAFSMLKRFRTLYLVDVFRLGESESPSHLISLYPHDQYVSGLSQFLHCELCVKAPLELSNLCLIVSYNQHVVDVKGQIDPGLVGQLPNIHTWVGV